MILVIDNYDSFTWNLVQYLGEIGVEPVVRRNDEVTVRGVEEMAPQAVVISPGPCTPAEAGISVELIRQLGDRIPILGVCLGHQAIGEAFGARVVRAARLVHGKTSQIEHQGEGPFASLPNPLTATRYHSLVVEELPRELEPLAWATDTLEDGSEVRVLMGLRHRSRPVWGVQFHPESVLTQGGHQLLSNFMNVAVDWRAGR